MTILARSEPYAYPAEPRPAGEACTDARLIALRGAVAEGRYRIDAEAIAVRLITTFDSHAESLCQRH